LILDTEKTGPEACVAELERYLADWKMVDGLS
jgi:hypothetical protein